MRQQVSCLTCSLGFLNNQLENYLFNNVLLTVGFLEM